MRPRRTRFTSGAMDEARLLPASKRRWEKKRGQLSPITEIDRRIEWANQNDPGKLPALNAIKTYPSAMVLADLPSRQIEMWALLGLNCGMTNSDIGSLKCNRIVHGYLNRKRVKTEGVENAPTVTCKLWTETCELLHERKSGGEYLFTSQDGSSDGFPFPAVA